MSIGPVDIEFVVKGDIDQKMRKVSRTVKGESGAMNEQMQRLTRNTETVGDRFGKLKRIGQGLLPIASVTAAALAFRKLAKDVYRFSNDYSKAMREVQTISVAVQKDMKGISDEIINMAANAPDNAIQLAQAYYQVVSAGHDGAKGLQLLKIASQSATAGITDTKTAADGLTTVINAWGKDAAEAERVADVMFKTVEKGKTTFPELAANISQVAPLASSMKISFEEVSAAIASLTKQGVTTPMAVTQIRQAIISANEVLGDGWTKAMSFQEGLQKIRDMAGGSDTKLREMMGRVEGMNAVLALTGDKASEAASDLDAMTKATGAMNSAYGKMMEEADNQWSLVHNKWQRELKGLGDTIKMQSTGIARFLNAMMSNSSDAFDILSRDLSEFTNRWAAMQALRDETLGGWTDTWFGKLAETITGLDFDEWRALFASEDKLREWLENSKAVREEMKKQEEAFKRTDTASIITEISDIDRKIKKEQELLRFYEKMGVDDPELKRIQNRIQGYENEKVVWERLLDAKKNAWIKDDKGTGTEDKVVSGFKAMQEELKKLQEDILDADGEQQEKIAERILELQRELGLREQIVEEIIKAARNEKPPEKVETKGKETKVSDIVIPKRVGLEYDKLNEKIENTNKRVAEFLAKLKVESLSDFADFSFEISYFFRDLADIIGDFNPELAEMFDHLGRVADMGSKLASGRYFEAAAAGIRLFVDQYKRAMDTGNIEERIAQKWEEFEKWIAASNRELEQYIKLRDEAIGKDRYSATDKLIEETKQNIEDTQNTLNELELSFTLSASGWFNAPYNKLEDQMDKIIADLGGGILKLEGHLKEWGVAFWKEVKGVFTYDLSQLLYDDSGEFTIDKINELINDGIITDQTVINAVDDYIDLTDKLRKAEQQKQELLTVTAASNIADSIIEGFAQGERSAADFADNFEDLMKNAILNAVKIQALEEPLREWYQTFSDMMESEGVLTEAEINRLQEMYDIIIRDGEDKLKELERIAGLSFADNYSASGLTGGAIRALTEETGGMIYGQLMGIRYDIKNIITNMMRDEDTVQRNLAYMAEIAANTRHNSKLNSIDNRLQEMNLYLKNI